LNFRIGARFVCVNLTDAISVSRRISIRNRYKVRFIESKIWNILLKEGLFKIGSHVIDMGMNIEIKDSFHHIFCCILWLGMVAVKYINKTSSPPI
jgi:hypothetical protein